MMTKIDCQKIGENLSFPEGGLQRLAPALIVVQPLSNKS